MTIALGAAGWFVTLIGMNVLGFALFWWHPDYMNDQGIDTALFFLSLLLSPIGALYGVASGVLLSVANRRWPEKRRRIRIRLAIGYLALLAGTVLIVGFWLH
jgi:hypothetical protein